MFPQTEEVGRGSGEKEKPKSPPGDSVSGFYLTLPPRPSEVCKPAWPHSRGILWSPPRRGFPAHPPGNVERTQILETEPVLVVGLLLTGCVALRMRPVF